MQGEPQPGLHQVVPLPVEPLDGLLFFFLDKSPNFPPPDLPQSHKRGTPGRRGGHGTAPGDGPCGHHAMPPPGGVHGLWMRGLALPQPGSCSSARPPLIHPNLSPRPPAVKPRHIRRIPGIAGAAEPHTCRSGRLGRCRRLHPGPARRFLEARHRPKAGLAGQERLRRGDTASSSPCGQLVTSPSAPVASAGAAPRVGLGVNGGNSPFFSSDPAPWRARGQRDTGGDTTAPGLRKGLLGTKDGLPGPESICAASHGPGSGPGCQGRCGAAQSLPRVPGKRHRRAEAGTRGCQKKTKTKPGTCPPHQSP